MARRKAPAIPDEMLETTDEFIADCARLIDTYHDPAPFSMRQVVVSPCQPVNCYRETFVESAALARDKGVFLHTHVGEGESPFIAARHGMRTVDYLEQIGFAGPDTFYAHCWELTDAELRQMAASGTGVSHCPEPVYLVGAEVTDIPAMAAFGVRLGLGCDGAASNDNSNLMHCIHSAYMLQCLVASGRTDPVPTPARFLSYATEGGASLLGRADIGALRPGMAADLFAIDTRKLDYIGTRHDPVSLIPKVGIGTTVDMTMINGRIVWRDGHFPGLDEGALFAQALLERDASASNDQVAQARDKALRAPLLMLLIVDEAKGDADIDLNERVLSAGCAVQNFMLLAHAMGSGSGLTSGKALKADSFRAGLGLGASEHAICCLSVGTVSSRKPFKPRPEVSQFTRIW